MPQLLSRMDPSGWLTPSIADILEHGVTPPGGEELIRAQAMELQRILTEQGAPTRIVNVRPTSSRTLYIARPDPNNRFVRKQAITPGDIARSFKRIRELHPDWTLGFLPSMQDHGALGVLLRTEQHRAMRLRQLLVRNAFREHESRLALVLGVTLEQQLVVRDLAQFGHLLVVGAEANRRPYVWGMLLTLAMMNTPAELRLALAGAYSQSYKVLLETPHVLGRLLGSPREGQRLLDGLVKEVQRRQQWFNERAVADIDAYNTMMIDNHLNPLPRIVFLIDSLTDANWREAVERWTPTVYDLLLNGAKTGIHLLLTTNQDYLKSIPDLLLNSLSTSVMIQSPGINLSDRLRGLPEPTHQFVDAVLVETNGDTGTIPLEIYTISDEEIQRATSYWGRASAQRVHRPAGTGQPTSPTGVTSLLPAVRETGTMAAVSTDSQEMPRVEPKPAARRSHRETQPAVPSWPDADATTLHRAQALAAYLGWLGLGPLQDVLGLSADDAQTMLATLQSRGILDSDGSPTPRFVRLAANPLNESAR